MAYISKGGNGNRQGKVRENVPSQKVDRDLAGTGDYPLRFVIEREMEKTRVEMCICSG